MGRGEDVGENSGVKLGFACGAGGRGFVSGEDRGENSGAKLDITGGAGGRGFVIGEVLGFVSEWVFV